MDSQIQVNPRNESVNNGKNKTVIWFSCFLQGLIEAVQYFIQDDCLIAPLDGLPLWSC